MRAKGALTAAEQQAVIDWLQNHIQGEFRCVVCNSQSWSVQDHLAAPFTARSLGGFGTDAVYPYAQVMCTNCGNTHFINAIHAGIYKGQFGPKSGGSGLK